jgi:hypothetical protein
LQPGQKIKVVFTKRAFIVNKKQFISVFYQVFKLEYLVPPLIERPVYIYDDITFVDEQEKTVDTLCNKLLLQFNFIFISRCSLFCVIKSCIENHTKTAQVGDYNS